MNVQAKDAGTLEAEMQAMGRAARDAAAALREASAQQKNKALLAAASAIRAAKAQILAANEEDMRAGVAYNLTSALLDRLKLDDKRIEATAQAV
ncbi:MAG: glutamate-5-semialdehyde dehydrogenase, partial [Alphaproteobacteria bacterium]|nr:glutamate-5-semialdehyde dehydrogenase [Alphaproteobacteria bacterium]